MKASFTSTEIKTFAEQCQDQHGKNFAAYKKAMVQGKVIVAKPAKKKLFKLF